MRLDTGGNVIQSDAAIVRHLQGTNSDGVSMKRSSILAKPLQANALGNLSSINTADCEGPSSNASGPIDKVEFQLFVFGAPPRRL